MRARRVALYVWYIVHACTLAYVPRICVGVGAVVDLNEVVVESMYLYVSRLHWHSKPLQKQQNNLVQSRQFISFRI